MLYRQWLMVTKPLNLCLVINSNSWTLNKIDSGEQGSTNVSEFSGKKDYVSMGWWKIHPPTNQPQIYLNCMSGDTDQLSSFHTFPFLRSTQDYIPFSNFEKIKSQ